MSQKHWTTTFLVALFACGMVSAGEPGSQSAGAALIERQDTRNTPSIDQLRSGNLPHADNRIVDLTNTARPSFTPKVPATEAERQRAADIKAFRKAREAQVSKDRKRLKETCRSVGSGAYAGYDCNGSVVYEPGIMNPLMEPTDEQLANFRKSEGLGKGLYATQPSSADDSRAAAALGASPAAGFSGQSQPDSGVSAATRSASASPASSASSSSASSGRAAARAPGRAAETSDSDSAVDAAAAEREARFKRNEEALKRLADRY